MTSRNRRRTCVHAGFHQARGTTSGILLPALVAELAAGADAHKSRKDAATNITGSGTMDNRRTLRARRARICHPHDFVTRACAPVRNASAARRASRELFFETPWGFGHRLHRGWYRRCRAVVAPECAPESARIERQPDRLKPIPANSRPRQSAGILRYPDPLVQPRALCKTAHSLLYPSSWPK